VRRAPRILLLTLLGLLVAGVAVWGSLAIYYRAPFGDLARQGVAILFALGGVAAIVGLFTRSARRATVVFAVAFAALLVWWSTIHPRNDRDWQTDVAVLPWAEVNGDLVTVHNIRNFDYRTETDYTPRYDDKTFDLRELDSLDLIATYWMGPAVAHMMVSFGFGGRDYLAVSIETRKERSESYSTLAGFFREYELYYVVADERDLIGLRTNFRKDPPEEVYIYRTVAPPENARRLFLSYLEQINSLRDHPEFYNTATTNCTTNIWMHTKVNPQHLPFNWKILVSGYLPQFVYESGRLDSQLPFEELHRRGHVNDAAHAADDAPDFSQRIRAGLPIPPPLRSQ
jgi:hypothetical protein